MPTTQPTLWTPEAVVWVAGAIIGAVSLTLIPSVIALVKAIGATRVASIAAQAAKGANEKSDIANTRAGNNAVAITAVQNQVAAVSLQTPTPTSPVTPVEFPSGSTNK